MNKKGLMDAILNLFRLLFLIVVFFSVIFLARAFIIQNIDVFEPESKLLSHRLMLSKDLNYVDQDTMRSYTGIIDLEKFKSDEFSKKILNSIYYGNPNTEAAAKITLKVLDMGLESEITYEKFYNKELYDEKKVIVEARLVGAGSAKRQNFNYYVLIKDKDNYRKGVLNIDVILPNR